VTVWVRDGDAFVAVGDGDHRRAIECPDCRGPWPTDAFARGESCPGCGLAVEDLRAAADFVDRLLVAS
jgi:hypothetical protein